VLDERPAKKISLNHKKNLLFFFCANALNQGVRSAAKISGFHHRGDSLLQKFVFEDRRAGLEHDLRGPPKKTRLQMAEWILSSIYEMGSNMFWQDMFWLVVWNHGIL
jgi:hypothetical protein